MSRDSQPKTKPDPDRDPRARADLAALRRPPGHYTPDSAQSFETLVHVAAMHEAGHVIAAVALGFGLQFAILHIHDDQTKKGVGGYTEVFLKFLGGFDSADKVMAASITPDALRVRTMQVLAGRIAESFINTNTEDVEHGSEDDDVRAVKFAMVALGATATPPDLTNYIKDQSEEMSRLLRPLAPAVFRVANYLIAHSNEEVPGATLEGLMPDPPAPKG